MCEKSTRFARGTVWWVNDVTDTMCTTSQKGSRPFLIISDSEYNIKWSKVTVIPLSHQNKYEGREFVCVTTIDGCKSYILTDQIRQLDISRLDNYVYTLNNKVLQQVDYNIVRLYTGNSVVSHHLSNSCNTCYKNTVSEKPVTVETDNKTLLTESKPSLNKVTDTKVGAQAGIRHNVQITNEIKHVKREKGHPRTFKGRDESAMPYYYYKVLDNNITWWNDFLAYGIDYCKKKYNLSTDVKFSKRKYLVKKFLLEYGYDLTQPIQITREG